MSAGGQMAAATRPDAAAAQGALDGVVLLRYAHVFRDRVSGGAEQYLRALDEELLERHALTVVRMHLVGGAGHPGVAVEERVGRGRIVWVPVRLREVARSPLTLPARFGELARNCGGAPGGGIGAWAVALKRGLRNGGGHLRYGVMVLSDELERVLDERRVDLVVTHWISYDLPPLVRAARRRGIPLLVVHHFENTKLAGPLAQGITAVAAGVGGVSGQLVPAGLEGRFRRLSDAVDTRFFTPAGAAGAREPVVLLAGRITAGKGHADLLEAAHRLRAGGVPVRVQFAGVVESPAVQAALERQVAERGLGGAVEFLGQVGQAELRDLYGRAAVVALPSSHEGLGRVLLEAQAMATPVVAYANGGIPEALDDRVSGFLVPPGDIGALAARLGELLGEPARREAMGAAGRRFVEEQFSVGALVARHEAFYQSALAGRHGAVAGD